ncbi:hypothetical protein RND71_015315 [Anisodus tanguticus]|uniref:Kinesin motor domain-containing protein n=1 Tax=Anisodus tanguticus TaxID=243964 RepID=A0AAE1S688_9SOLA|nr:hypothetical protein RND71_015315 [Anisodus tanguticus]
MEETHNTLKFASRAKRVEIYASRNKFDQLRRGMLVGVNPVELMTLKQQEEEAKAALMRLIQRLTKLILVSSKNSIPGYLGDVAGHQRSHSPSEDDKMDSSMLIDTSDLKHRRSSSKWNDGISHVGNAITESAQVGELIIGFFRGSKLPICVGSKASRKR